MSSENKTTSASSGYPTKRSITVFFPCYNESANIEALVVKAVGVLEKISGDFEIIIVDDGSTDGTAEIAQCLAARFAAVKVVCHPRNLGYGSALVSGFRAAQKELIFFTDGDGQFDIAEMAGFLPLIERYDIVCGYRINRQDNIVRKFNAFCWTRLVNFLFGMKIRDIDCAFKLFRREVTDAMKIESTGALVNAEILARVVRKGYSIVQAGVHHYPRKAGLATGARPAVIVRAFVELFKLRRKIISDNRAV